MAVVGKDQKFKLCSQGEVEEYLSVFADEDGGDDDEDDDDDDDEDDEDDEDMEDA